MLRWKNTAGRVLLELMWSELVTWDGERGTVNLTKLARRTNVRPVRLVEYLRELNALGYLTTLEISYKTINFTFRKPGWMMAAQGSPVLSLQASGRDAP